MVKFNLVILILSSAIGLLFIPVKAWMLDGCSDRDTDDIKIFLNICDTFKDIIFVYVLLYFLLFGFN